MRGTLHKVSALSRGERDTMYALFTRYYECVSRPAFDRDLDDKSDIVLLRSGRTIVGFSTLKLVRWDDEHGHSHRAVYSGDTVIDRAHWGGSALQWAFLRYVLLAWAKRPWMPLHWLLISKGYKTYLLLANNFPTHYPRYEHPTPHAVQQLMDGLATRLFGAHYDPECGVVDFGESRGQLRRGVAEVEAAMADTHPRIRFFAQHNPGWNRGTELVCLARISPNLVWHYSARVLIKAIDRTRRAALRTSISQGER